MRLYHATFRACDTDSVGNESVFPFPPCQLINISDKNKLNFRGLWYTDAWKANFLLSENINSRGENRKTDLPTESGLDAVKKPMILLVVQENK